MSKKKIILRIMLSISILAVIFFIGAIVRELYIDRQSRSFYSDMAAGIEMRPHESGSTEPGHTDESEASSPQSGDTENAWVPYADFDALNTIFPGIAAWIKMDDTNIDYPVMQYTDNDYFLTRLPNGTPHRSGSIFLDYRNSRDFSDKSILLYGHESRTEDMFGSLKNYREQAYYEENPVMYLYTPQKDYMIVLFAGHLAHSQRDHPPLQFEDDEQFLAYIESLKSISFFSSEVDVGADDRIVSLCTCAYDFNDARLVIVGILIEI